MIMARRSLHTFPLSLSHKTALYRCGFITVSDLKEAEKAEISRATGLNSPEVNAILDIIEETLKNQPQPVSALDILRKEEEQIPIVSFCERLDEALGGGVQLGQLTEISGVPGVGKTQLCIQLCCDVQIPAVFGGLEGEVILIDTEGGIVIDRVVEIVTATVNHCKQIAEQEQDPDLQGLLEDFSVHKLLAGIHVHKCLSESHLLALISLLPSLLEENQKVKLVVLDSVAFHFRHDFEDLSLRTRILTNLAQTLLSIAKKYNISVVVTNQMTTKVRSGDSSSVVPGLGDSWGHACTHRLTLEYGNGCRVAWVRKSPTQKQGKVLYQITKDGFRDSVMSFKEDKVEEDDTGGPQEHPSKRQRCT